MLTLLSFPANVGVVGDVALTLNGESTMRTTIHHDGAVILHSAHLLTGVQRDGARITITIRGFPLPIPLKLPYSEEVFQILQTTIRENLATN